MFLRLIPYLGFTPPVIRVPRGGTLDGIARRASGQVRSYFGTWAASRAKTIFAILIASCSLKRWVQVAAFTC